MFEEQSQKLYTGFSDRANNLFSRKPFISTLLISVLVSTLVFVISMDYKRGDAKIEILEEKEKEISQEIQVDLSGAVKNPGVYNLNAGSRLSELISLSGGFVNDVSALWVSKNLNLSQSVMDSQKVYIPFEWDINGLEGSDGVKALSLGVINSSKQSDLVNNQLKSMEIGLARTSEVPSSSSSSGIASNKVNVNSSTASELDALPGVGPAFAGRIIENRPYASFEEFEETSSLPPTLAESLKDLISY